MLLADDTRMAEEPREAPAAVLRQGEALAGLLGELMARHLQKVTRTR